MYESFQGVSNNMQKEKSNNYTDLEISREVCKSLLRVCKEVGLYKKFIKGFFFIRKECEHLKIDKPNTFDDLSKCLIQYSRIAPLSFKQGLKYDKVGNLLNHLMHIILESVGVDPCKLSKIGEVAFEMSCRKLYGEEYVNEIKQRDSLYPIKPQNDLERFLCDSFITLKLNGELDGIKWEVFVDKIRTGKINITPNGSVYDTPF